MSHIDFVWSVNGRCLEFDRSWSLYASIAWTGEALRCFKTLLFLTGMRKESHAWNRMRNNHRNDL